ncbi:hypothetical protein TNCT_545241 [Trichonephila clavata]|uniref:Uncharacterized protein n=1 Tax=Trichonephila clavata TaxID=2740835 RepID=A0A8X6ID37_TRICU|nr:hypothetical protein TNCT_545241 [Trichonephila clavata]
MDRKEKNKRKPRHKSSQKRKTERHRSPHRHQSGVQDVFTIEASNHPDKHHSRSAVQNSLLECFLVARNRIIRHWRQSKEGVLQRKKKYMKVVFNRAYGIRHYSLYLSLIMAPCNA